MDGSPDSGMKWTIFEKRSMTNHITVLFSEASRLVMKSMEIWDRGCSGTSNPWGMNRPMVHRLTT